MNLHLLEHQLTQLHTNHFSGIVSYHLSTDPTGSTPLPTSFLIKALEFHQLALIKQIIESGITIVKDGIILEIIRQFNDIYDRDTDDYDETLSFITFLFSKLNTKIPKKLVKMAFKSYNIYFAILIEKSLGEQFDTKIKLDRIIKCRAYDLLLNFMNENEMTEEFSIYLLQKYSYNRRFLTIILKNISFTNEVLSNLIKKELMDKSHSVGLIVPYYTDLDVKSNDLCMLCFIHFPVYFTQFYSIFHTNDENKQFFMNEISKKNPETVYRSDVTKLIIEGFNLMEQKNKILNF